jgi:transposase
MDVLIERCAGMDVHRDTVVATVRRPGPGGTRRSETRTFATMTRQLEMLADWLTEQKVTLAGMESTGIYWKPVYYVLEDRFPIWVINAEHLRNVPGRKTDVADSVWIAQLIEHGLVSPSFVPPRNVRLLRDVTRHGRRLTEERTRAIQRLEKVLQDAGIKLTSVASTILGKTGRAILAALLAGEEDPAVLAELAKGRLRPKIPALREALTHRFRLEHHGVLIAQMLAHIDFLESAILETHQRVEVLLRPVADIVELVMTIPGVGRRIAEVLIAEVGLDMTVFPTAGHLAS